MPHGLGVIVLPDVHDEQDDAMHDTDGHEHAHSH